MGSVNKVILVGNLGKDPEIRSNQAGGAIANFTLATGESWKDRSTGERREKVEWHRIVVFNDRVAENIERYLHKGDQVCVEGSLQTRKWTDQSGAEKYTTEIVVDQFRGEVTFLRTRNDEERSGAEDRPSRQPRQQRERAGASRSPAPSGDDLDDSIPF